MGGFFGAVSANDCIQDVFFGTDYHSHLGTRRGGMTSFSPELGFQRNIHSIENSPFRTKFEKDVDKIERKHLYRLHKRHRSSADNGYARS